MNGSRDDDADDLFVDHCLQQELGGARPPDVAADIARASAQRLAVAAASVDTATAARARTASRARFALAAAAALLIGGGTLWLAVRPTTPQPTVAERATALLDEFHRVMPMHPFVLRDAARRRDVAGQALPVLREILALHAREPDEPVFGARILEMHVYAAVLEDAATLASLRQRAAAGDAAAAIAQATARVTVSDVAARSAALAELGNLLTERRDLERSVAQCLVTADLSVDEAEGLAARVEDRFVQRWLVQAAQQALDSPRALVGQPLELFGRLADDRLFSTNALRGRAVLVCFWASWCRPSLAAIDEIRRAQREHPEIAVVCVSCDNSAAELRTWLAAHPDAGWIHFFDANRPGWHELAFTYNVRAVPFVLMLDRDGVVREVHAEHDVAGALRRQLGR